MPNTVHGPYAPTSWVNGTTPVNATHMGNLETQSAVALAGFNPDLIAACVVSGVTCTKDGVTANQLDIAPGRAYLVMSDGTVALIVVVADNTHTTSTPTTTYHLYLQPDGTWYWNTANTPAANSLHICDVTTDGSSNILAVTDMRPLGPLVVAGGMFFKRGAGGVLGTLAAGDLLDVDGSGNIYLKAAAGMGINFQIPSGTTVTGINANGALSIVGKQNTAGSFGVPIIVAQTLNQNVTVTTLTQIVNITAPATGFYRVNVGFTIGGASATKPTVLIAWTDPNNSTAVNDNPVGAQGVLLNGSNTVNPGGAEVASVCIYAKTGTSIHVSFQDTTTPVNDFVTAMIERLA